VRVFEVLWTDAAVEDYESWARDRGKLDRISALVASIEQTPFSGIGKPEPLLFNLKGCWSRRIDREHRLVYEVEDGKVTMIQARTHYSR
jgi:toxin YoeB